MIKVKAYLESEKLKDKLKYISIKYGKEEIFEDIYQDYCVHILSGKGSKQTVEQFFIDYSRKKGFYVREGFNDSAAFSLRNKSQSLEDIDFLIGDCDNIPDGLDLEDLLDGHKRSIYILMTKWGFTFGEIAHLFNVSESRVCQIVKSIKEDCFNLEES